MSDAVNLYAPPKAHVEDVVPDMGEAEAIRREHIKIEASVRSIGILYYLSGGLLCVGAIVFFNGAALRPFAGGPVGQQFLVRAVILLVLGALGFFLGRGIRTLRPWARHTLIVISIIGLIGIPVGTLINVYILYLLFCKKGRRIFESDYPDIVAATPHVKYRTSVFVWIVLALLLLAMVGIFLARFMHL